MEKVKLLRALSRIKQVADSSSLTSVPFVRDGISYVKGKWFREFYDDKAESVVIDFEGTRIRVPRQFVNHYAFHEYEPITRRTFTETLKPGMVVVDVGAHIGSFALLAA